MLVKEDEFTEGCMNDLLYLAWGLTMSFCMVEAVVFKSRWAVGVGLAVFLAGGVYIALDIALHAYWI